MMNGIDPQDATTPAGAADRQMPRLREIVAIASGAPFLGMMLTIVLPILPNISDDITGGKDDPLLGRMVVTMPTMGIVVGGVLAAWLLSRISARTLLLWTIVLFGIVGAAGLALHGWALLGSRFVIGAVATCIAAASTTLIGERIQAEKRPRIIGFQGGGSSLIGVIVMNISGALSDHFDWRVSFLLFPVVAAIGFLFASTSIPVRPPAAASATPAARAGKSSWRLLLDLWPLYLFLMALNAAAFTTNSQASFLLAADGVSSAAVRAHMMTINQVAIVVASLAYPLTRLLVGSRWIPALVLTVMATGMILLGLSRELGLAAVGLAFLGLGNGTLFPHQATLILARAAPQIRGRAVGLLFSNQFLADSINPFLLAPMITGLGLQNAIVAIGGMAAAGALFVIGRTSLLPRPALAGEPKGR